MSNSEFIKNQESSVVKHQAAAEDEIDLLDILIIFKKRCWLMFGIVAVVTLSTIVVVLLIPKVYRAEVIISPPLARDVEQFNIFDLDTNSSGQEKDSKGNYFYKIDELEVYDKFVRFIKSKKLQYEFYHKKNLFDYFKGEEGDNVSEIEVFHEKFADHIKIDDKRRKNNNMLENVTISLEGHDETNIVKWLNEYVNYIDEHTVKSIVMAIDERARLQENSIKKQIESLRNTEEFRRTDLIEQYKEAVVIAETIGMTDQVSISLAPYNQLVEKKSVTFNPGNVPLYLRGSNALRAKLNLLQQRKNGDHFIPALRDLQQRLNFFSHINVTVNEAQAGNVDQPAYVSGNSVKPKRKLIVMMGVFLGCLLAVFMAFVKHWQESIKNRQVS